MTVNRCSTTRRVFIRDFTRDIRPFSFYNLEVRHSAFLIVFGIGSPTFGLSREQCVFDVDRVWTSTGGGSGKPMWTGRKGGQKRDFFVDVINGWPLCVCVCVCVFVTSIHGLYCAYYPRLGICLISIAGVELCLIGSRWPVYLQNCRQSPA